MARPLAAKMKLAHAHVEPLRLGAILAEADARDFRIGVDDGRHEIPVDVAGPAGDPLGHGRAVLLGLVGEHRAGDDIADGPDAGHGGAQVVVDLDALLLVELHAGLLEAEVFRDGPPADGDEDLVGGELHHLALALCRQNRRASPWEFGTCHLRLQPGDPAHSLRSSGPVSRAGGRQQADDIIVVAGGDLGQKLHDGHLRAEARPDGAEFESDGAAADDHETRRHGVKADGLVGGDDGPAVEREKGQLGGRGAGGEDDVLRGDLPACRAGRADRDRGRRRRASAWPVSTVILRALASWATPPTSFWTTASFFFISAARSSSIPVSLMPAAAAWWRAQA